MKKQASDQYAHDRRYQKRKRAEATKQTAKKKNASENVGQAPAGPTKEVTKQ